MRLTMREQDLVREFRKLTEPDRDEILAQIRAWLRMYREVCPSHRKQA